MPRSTTFKRALTPPSSPSSSSPSPSGSHNMIRLKVITDDKATIYVDGDKVLETKPIVVQTVNISASFEVIAIEVTSFFLFIGFMAKTSSGIETNKSWKCVTNTQSTKWMKTTFDDSKWPQAVPYANNDKGVPFGPIPLTYKGFPPQSLWINASNTRNDNHLYCRRRRR